MMLLPARSEKHFFGWQTPTRTPTVPTRHQQTLCSTGTVSGRLVSFRFSPPTPVTPFIPSSKREANTPKGPCASSHRNNTNHDYAAVQSIQTCGTRPQQDRSNKKQRRPSETKLREKSRRRQLTAQTTQLHRTIQPARSKQKTLPRWAAAAAGEVLRTRGKLHTKNLSPLQCMKKRNERPHNVRGVSC